MSDREQTIDEIKGIHRQRRYALKVQAKIDRALESFVRINWTAWEHDADAKTREAANKRVKAIIAAAHKGQGEAHIIDFVGTTDRGRKPFDGKRAEAEKTMEKLARGLPTWPWVKSIRGAAELGLATIVAEAGDLSNYPNPAKLWKRLGYAPYDGLAGSTWKRDSWRPRALTKDEWIDNPFSGERYALIHQIGVALFRGQWQGADEDSDTGRPRPNCRHGEIYAARRAHTATTHPDWTKQHSHMDALRIMTKAFLKDLWVEWRRCDAADAVKQAAE